jgi:hypothetical protein
MLVSAYGVIGLIVKRLTTGKGSSENAATHTHGRLVHQRVQRAVPAHLRHHDLRDPEGPGLTLAELRSLVEQRLHLLGPLRRRLIEVPFGMDEPYWIEDPDFDLGKHLMEDSLAGPGDDHQLADLTARIAGRPLDRSRPLWELHLIHGLEGGRKALIKKFHHAAVDGASGLEITGILLDPSP